MRVILASESLFRGKALEILGLKYEKIPSHIDEKAIRHENAQHMAKRIAKAKAEHVAKQHPDALIIAGDCFVVFEGKVYEKPVDLAEAKRMLKSFSGKEQDIISSVAVYDPKTKKVSTDVGVTTVRFRTLIDREIADYVGRYPVLKCSAAYEGDGLLRFAQTVRGDHPPVVGLPMPELIGLLRKAGLKV